MLQNPCKTLGFKKNMVYKIPPGGGGKPYPASGLNILHSKIPQTSTTKTEIRLGGCPYRVKLLLYVQAILTLSKSYLLLQETYKIKFENQNRMTNLHII